MSTGWTGLALQYRKYIETMLHPGVSFRIAPWQNILPTVDSQKVIHSSPLYQCLTAYAHQLQWHSCKDAAYLFKLIDTPLQSISNTVSSESVESLSMSLASVTDRCFSGMTSSIPSASNESLFKRSDRPSTCSNHCVAYRIVAWLGRPGLRLNHNHNVEHTHSFQSDVQVALLSTYL